MLIKLTCDLCGKSITSESSKERGEFKDKHMHGLPIAYKGINIKREEIKEGV